MKYIQTIILLLLVIIIGCDTQKSAVNADSADLAISEKEKEIFRSKEQDTVTIANDSVEYEITIIEPGFYAWLNSIAQPRGYYSKEFMENRNDVYVTNWNIRATQPTIYNTDLYLWPINYDPSIDYGYEVNYQLYNYFLYFQRKYNQRLGPFLPRIN
ncbi:DUF6146 family protein [Robertkochia aurantiaca]|uniref:DUF6146 family protein n=1 Tax=Robertkochia aurantiaca TaxID=2873700 RepID=UPI001CCBE59D|nr:DUF6146 family protein [Robertkochia sp. 3YJGBD-33]